MTILPAGVQKIVLFAPGLFGSVATVVEVPENGHTRTFSGYGVVLAGPASTYKYSCAVQGKDSGPLDGFTTFGATAIADYPEEVPLLPDALGQHTEANAEAQHLN